jgi:uncharacterized phiE125 gp8 family phage protein
MTLRAVELPTEYPVTLTQVKFDARIDGTEYDSFISETLIPAATSEAEKFTHRKLMPQTWELVLDAFPVSDFPIGCLPVRSITSVKYYDGENVLQTLSTSYYTLDADTLPGWVRLDPDYTWPSTREMKNAVIVRFEAGYEDEDSVPSAIKAWIRAQAAAAADAQTGAGQYKLTPFVDGLLDGYKLSWI